MINLIPHSAKRSLVKEYWIRVISVWLMTWSFASLCAAAAIYPAYLLIDSQVSVYESSAAEASARVADFKSVSEELRRTSEEARLIVEARNEPLFSNYIELLNRLEGEAIDLNNIRLIHRDDGTIAPIEISGVARDRIALRDFRDRLLAEAEVATVDFPISNLAKEQDINFEIIITLGEGTES